MGFNCTILFHHREFSSGFSRSLQSVELTKFWSMIDTLVNQKAISHLHFSSLTFYKHVYTLQMPQKTNFIPQLML